jgi:quercetin dioxygenase-like cupin family protein
MTRPRSVAATALLAILASAIPGLAAQEATAAAEPAVASAFDDAGLAWGPCPAFLPEGCAIAVLHGDPAKPNADLFFKVPGGAIIANHTHASAERMVLVSGQMEVTYEGQAAVTLTPGMYAYGPAGRPHHATCADGPPCVLFIAFEAPVDAVPVAAPAD